MLRVNGVNFGHELTPRHGLALLERGFKKPAAHFGGKAHLGRLDVARGMN
jgi:hypothetical protein